HDWAKEGDILQLLHYIEKGGDVNYGNILGRTPLMLAVINRHNTLVEKLISCSDINRQNKNKNTALMYAAEYNNVVAAKLLLSSNADCDLRDRMGETALILAARNNAFAVVQLLVRYGADITVKSCLSMTALDYPQSDKNKVIIPFLKKALAIDCLFNQYVVAFEKALVEKLTYAHLLTKTKNNPKNFLATLSDEILEQIYYLISFSYVPIPSQLDKMLYHASKTNSTTQLIANAMDGLKPLLVDKVLHEVAEKSLACEETYPLDLIQQRCEALIAKRYRDKSLSLALA
ncbi:MAG: ankyrin repeat domain-containing protein, partial [Burkholderiales bacterium]